MNANFPPVSIIIVNYNGKAFIDRCLSSVLRQTYPSIEVILVDNGSTDGSLEIAKEKYPAVKIIENGANLGFCKANNIGIEASKGEFVITLNNDTEAMPDWVEEHVKAMEAHPEAGMCSSKMMSMTKPGMIDSTGLCISRSGACWDRGQYEWDQGQYDQLIDIFGPCAGAAVYRKKMLDEIGLFDEDFFAYLEDADLAFRGRIAGWKCLFVPKAVVYHYRGGTGGCISEYTVYFGNRNLIWFTFKNYPLPYLLVSAPWILCRNAMALLFYVLKGYGLTIIRSKADGILGLPAMLSKQRNQRFHFKHVKPYIKTFGKLVIPGSSR